MPSGSDGQLISTAAFYRPPQPLLLPSVKPALCTPQSHNGRRANKTGGQSEPQAATPFGHLPAQSGHAAAATQGEPEGRGSRRG